MKWISFVSRLCLVAVIGLFIRPGEAMAVVTDVICPGVPNVLQIAINAAAPGDTIRITGSCIEEVSILKDDIDLLGVSPTDGITGRIFVSGFSRGVSLNNMTVKNCPSAGCIGIQAASRATLQLTNVISSGHKGPGFFIFDSVYAIITGGEFKDNGSTGILITESSKARISGISVTGNTRNGITVSTGSYVRISNSTIGSELSKNLRNGLFVGSNATVQSSNDVFTFNGRDGLLVSGGSSVLIENSTFSNNGRRGIQFNGNSSGVIEDSDIFGNTRRALTVSDNGFVIVEDSTITSDIPDSADNRGGILVNRKAVLRLRGNTITNTAVDGEGGGGIAIQVIAGSFLRQGTGHDTITSTNGLALSLSDQSQADLRDFTLTGDITVNRHALLRLRKDKEADEPAHGTVNGNIVLQRDSAISFTLESSGSVTVSGTVTCLDTESSADFEDQTAIDIVGGDGSELDCSGYGPGNSGP